MLQSNKGFTLAEVLITLLIIGVVASLIVPNLINDAQDAELKTAWKKNYSDLSQVLIQVKYENGSYTSFIRTSNSIKNELKNRMIAKAIWTSTLNYKSLSGVAQYKWYCNEGEFILNSGQYICIENDGTNNTYIFVDVNGSEKGPNVAGKDFFGIEVLDNKFLPLGATGTTKYAYSTTLENTCNTTSGYYSGWGCSAEYLTQ